MEQPIDCVIALLLLLLLLLMMTAMGIAVIILVIPWHQLRNRLPTCSDYLSFTGTCTIYRYIFFFRQSFAARPAWRRIQASENAGVRRKWMREMEARVATAGGGDADLPGLVAIQAASAASVLVFVAASFYVGRMLLWRRRGGHLKAVLSTAMGGE